MILIVRFVRLLLSGIKKCIIGRYLVWFGRCLIIEVSRLFEDLFKSFVIGLLILFFEEEEMMKNIGKLLFCKGRLYVKILYDF